MLEMLELKNFRCFKDYKIEFENFDMLVGKNNTGKSTLIDALKLVANVCKYAPYRSDYLEDRDVPFSQINLRHNYMDAESVVRSRFSNNAEIEIVFPVDGRPHAAFLKNGRPVAGRNHLGEYFKQALGVIPPVGTFEESEKVRERKYIQSILVSHLTPRHFRNIWHHFNDGFREFREIIEATWTGYTIEPPEPHFAENRIDMYFREKGITREIFWAGHGFQVWLQLMTFLVKLGRMETLILDEPDIYLHSDMQKKLVNVCKERSNQVIIATHAVDIIEEVEPNSIILIDKDSNRSIRLADIDEVQTCITQLGSLQNLKLAHFSRGKTCLFVEGKDLRYLKSFARKLKFQSFVKEDGFSVVPLEGFSNWDRLMHIRWIFKNAFGERVKCYVILDRDYYTGHEIDEIVDCLQSNGVRVHVWERKEIENYVINYDALYRMFTNRFREKHGNAQIPVTNAEFKEKMLSIFEDLKNGVFSQVIARGIETRTDRSIDPSTIISQISREFGKDWEDIEFRRRVIPGKEFFAKLNAWLSDNYRITIPIGYAIESLRTDEIDPEIQKVIDDFTSLVKAP